MADLNALLAQLLHPQVEAADLEPVPASGTPTPAPSPASLVEPTPAPAAPPPAAPAASLVAPPAIPEPVYGKTYADDSFSKRQKTMLMLSALQDIGSTMRGEQGGEFDKSYAGFGAANKEAYGQQMAISERLRRAGIAKANGMTPDLAEAYIYGDPNEVHKAILDANKPQTTKYGEGESDPYHPANNSTAFSTTTDGDVGTRWDNHGVPTSYQLPESSQQRTAAFTAANEAAYRAAVLNQPDWAPTMGMGPGNVGGYFNKKAGGAPKEVFGTVPQTQRPGTVGHTAFAQRLAILTAPVEQGGAGLDQVEAMQIAGTYQMSPAAAVAAAQRGASSWAIAAGVTDPKQIATYQQNLQTQLDAARDEAMPPPLRTAPPTAAGPRKPTPPPAGFDVTHIPPERVQQLRDNPKLWQQFDLKYGQGMAGAVLAPHLVDPSGRKRAAKQP